MECSFTSLLTLIVPFDACGRYVQSARIDCEQRVDTIFSKSIKIKLSTCGPTYPQYRGSYPHRYVQPVDLMINQNAIYTTEKLVLL